MCYKIKYLNFTIIFSSIFIGATSCAILQNKNYNPVKTNTNHYLFLQKSTDSSYGYTPLNPIKIGGYKKGEGLKNIEGYLESIQPKAPNTPFLYSRMGGCCEFRHKDGFAGIAFIEVYRLSFVKNDSSVAVFFNTYELDTIKVISGFQSY